MRTRPPRIELLRENLERVCDRRVDDDGLPDTRLLSAFVFRRGGLCGAHFFVSFFRVFGALVLFLSAAYDSSATRRNSSSALSQKRSKYFRIAARPVRS